MLNLSLFSLALATTKGQIKSLCQDSDTLIKEISALNSGSGQSYLIHVKGVISEGAEFIMEIVVIFLKKIDF